MPAPIRSASSHMPSTSASTCAVGVSPGAPKPATNAVARPPIASMSAAFWAIALRPTSCGVDQSSRKWRSCTSMSVDTTVRPSPADTTAASSPGPTTTARRLATAPHQPVDDGELAELLQRRGLSLNPLSCQCPHFLVAYIASSTASVYENQEVARQVTRRLPTVRRGW